MPRSNNSRGHAGRRNSRYSAGPSKRGLATEGKSVEFAIFYNVACDQAARVVHENISPDLRGKDVTESMRNFFNHEMDDRLAGILSNYLYKRYLMAANDSAMPALENTDKAFIKYLFKKLTAIRNFYSHYYHANTVLIFDEDAKRRIEQFHDQARWQFVEDYEKEQEKYYGNYREYPFFKKHGGKFFITQEGRTFLLSFFLPSGLMSKFLQQRKGSKRNNNPEFKIKHLIYRFYTHRDGASRRYYTHQETLMQNAAEGEHSLDFDKKALQIIGYLNDVPSTQLSKENIPLFYNGVEAKTPEQLVALVNQVNPFPADITAKLHKETKENPNTKEKYVIEHILLSLQGHEDFSFMIKPGALHRLLLEVMRRKSRGEEQTITDRLKELIFERQDVQSFITAPDQFLAGKENDLDKELKELVLYKLRNDRWQKKLGKRLELNYKLDKVFSFMEEEMAKQQFIELQFNYFFERRGRKPRAKNEFMRFAIQYLMDHNVTPSWNWLQYKNSDDINDEVAVKLRHKSGKIFHPTVVEGYTFGLNAHDQIIITIWHEAEERFYYFELGHRFIANMLFYHLKEQEAINDFFEPVIADLIKLSNNLQDLEFLHKNAIPVRMRRRIEEVAFDPKKAALKRILELSKYFKELIENPKQR